MPANFLSDVEIRAKFDTLAGPYVAAEQREAIVAAVLGLEECVDVGGLLQATRPSVDHAAPDAA